MYFLLLYLNVPEGFSGVYIFKKNSFWRLRGKWYWTWKGIIFHPFLYFLLKTCLLIPDFWGNKWFSNEGGGGTIFQEKYTLVVFVNNIYICSSPTFTPFLLQIKCQVHLRKDTEGLLVLNLELMRRTTSLIYLSGSPVVSLTINIIY